jgi:hypothetical protein
MKKWFKYFIYISLVFLVIALIKADYLVIPKIHSYFYLVLSIIFLFTGFIFNCVSWKKVINKSDLKVNFKNSIASVGLSIFGKYIPGKIWTIIGKAGYISEKYNYSFKKISSLSLNAQFITLWIGLILGEIGLFLLKGLKIWESIILVIWLFLTIIIFTDKTHKFTEKIINKFFNKKIDIPRLKFYNVLKVLPWFLLYWIFWCLSFYFLTKSMTGNNVSLNVGLGFALAGTLGVLAIIVPGGIGVREGILLSYLTLAGLNIQEATTISVVSRLWFLTGEFFIFILAVIIDRINKVK